MPKKKVLVIDDSIVIRKRISEILENKINVIEAKNGAEGLELIQTQRPDYIILDFLMPQKSGWEVYQEIQRNSNYRRLPLVIISGRKSEVTEKISEPFNCFSFLEKPFNRNELMQALKEATTKSVAKKSKITSKTTAPRSTKQSLVQKIQQLESTIDSLNKKVEGLEKQINIWKKEAAQKSKIN